MAVAGEVGGNATVGTVGAPAAIDGALHDGVVDGATIGVEAFNLSVGAQVDEQLAHSLDGLLGPSSKGGVLVILNLGVTADTTSEAGERDNLLLLSAVLEVGDSSVNLSSLHCLGDVVGVLEMNAEVSDLGFSG